MNWKFVAKCRLEAYQDNVLAARELRARLRELDKQAEGIRSARMDGPVQGSKGSGREAWLLDNITKKAELENRLYGVLDEIGTVERVLASMAADDKRVLEIFYIERPRDAVGEAMEALAVERAAVYRRRDKALETFTRRSYGDF